MFYPTGWVGRQPKENSERAQRSSEAQKLHCVVVGEEASLRKCLTDQGLLGNQGILYQVTKHGSPCLHFVYTHHATSSTLLILTKKIRKKHFYSKKKNKHFLRATTVFPSKTNSEFLRLQNFHHLFPLCTCRLLHHLPHCAASGGLLLRISPCP